MGTEKTSESAPVDAVVMRSPFHPANGMIEVCFSAYGDWSNFPTGSIATAIMGGHWYRTDGGWKWNGPNGRGGTFPRPGGDWHSVFIPSA
jgi:hypothetical protein